MYWIQSARADVHPVSKSPTRLSSRVNKIVALAGVAFAVHSISLTPFHMPSSIPTCLHHGVPVGLTILSASPTCLLALTSRPLAASPPPPPPLLFNFIAMLESVKLGSSLCCLPTRVNPWDEREAAIPVPPAVPLPRLCEDSFIHSSLMTGRCHCSGSELDDRRFKCR
jgi:hypothetical protein